MPAGTSAGCGSTMRVRRDAGERVPSARTTDERAARRGAGNAGERRVPAHAPWRDRGVVGVALPAEEDDLVERREVAPADAHERSRAAPPRRRRRRCGTRSGGSAGPACRRGWRSAAARASGRGPTRAARSRSERCRPSDPERRRRPAWRPRRARAWRARSLQQTSTIQFSGTAGRPLFAASTSSRRPTGLADGLALTRYQAAMPGFAPGLELRALRIPRSVLPRTDSAGVMNRAGV